MPKRRSITLTQESENSFRVKSWSNSAELSVGMVISRAKLNQWCSMPGLDIRVPGMTPPTESDQQLDLFEPKARKAVIASK